MNLALYTDDDREMLELAHRKYYRWREIEDWSEVMSQGMEHSDSVSC